ncbi:hypothetical protein JS756_11515 [Streptomyces actuosus]|uniref:Uncharacterized protein n=1 Tax=Streptomyces actuosus TaxID=1885 RepID=A0ABS2VNM3_STRAS|nr:hypothetical protein [Streptomyces actuosus]MBN0044725.1 hypothetical protein [Streptomyces actuosus]
MEAVEVVFGQFADTQRAGQANDPAMVGEFKRATTAPGRMGCCWSRTARTRCGTSTLPADD